MEETESYDNHNERMMRMKGNDLFSVTSVEQPRASFSSNGGF